jgi:lipopolysaccharide transport system ATP-binding protein
MHDVVHDGRTVLFVSHNMAMVQKLCNRAILINAGRVVAEGPTASVVGAYLDRIGRNAAFSLAEVPERSGKGSVRLTRIEIRSDDGSRRAIATGRSTRVILGIDRAMPGLSCSFDIFDQLGQPVTYFDSSEHGLNDSMHTSEAAFCCEIGELLLVPGRYRIDATVSLDGEVQDHIQGAAFIDVEQGLLDGRPVLRSSNYGNVVMHHRWTVPT